MRHVEVMEVEPVHEVRRTGHGYRLKHAAKRAALRRMGAVVVNLGS